MPLEVGGRADKAGNRYEIRCIIYELLKVIRETNYSVIIEVLGEEEQGTDILVTDINGVKEHIQCKVRNASKEYWSIADLNARGILENWKKHLETDNSRRVALVSPIGCSHIVDLHDRAVNTSGNPNDFVKYQIEEDGSEPFRKSYKAFCDYMGLKKEQESDVIKSLDYFRRIEVKQMSEIYVKDSIFQGLEFFFCTSKETVYNALVALIIEGDILGTEITASFLREYFEKQGIVMRVLEGDRRIVPQLKSVNNEYRKCFKTLREGLIERSEFEACIETIKKEQSFIVAGNAGYGKSGCTEAILNYCEKEDIPYIALKLDRRIPHGNCELWGQELGFSGAFSYAINAISKDKPAVIILDQLDALRWTQTNSTEALAICMELIRQVSYLNNEREKKIVIVFVCREYDLRNDNNIRSLFEKRQDSSYQIEWKKIMVKDFDESIVKKVVGEKYEQLTSKTKKLLQIPSNLYIWQHLDDNKVNDDCTTTSHLIEAWFKQICMKSSAVGVKESVVKDTLNKVVEKLDNMGRLYAPKRILDVEESGLGYLVSAELLIEDDNRVGFVHQSILDYFISKRMMQQYYEEEKIEDIIGEKSKQTPSRRYQTQMFLQNILEYDSSDFLEVGERMIRSSQIRYYVKYVFYEILRQISEPDSNVKSYIVEACKKEEGREYLVNNVICGRQVYVSLLREAGLLEQWFSEEKNKKTVFVLLKSITPEFETEDIGFIKQHAFQNEEDDIQFKGCFLHDIMQESDELFELRLLFYDKYPTWAQNLYIDIKNMMKHCQARTIRLLSCWIKNKITSKGRNVFQYEECLITENDSYLIENGRYVLDELLQYIPNEDEHDIYYSDWSGRFLYRRGLERAIVELIKKANIAIISSNPECFWEYYSPYMGKNYVVFDEIILHGFRYLPASYSDQVVTYLSKDLDRRIFDYTSGADDSLGLVKEVLRVHTINCSEECLTEFVQAVGKYVSPRAKDWYESRIEHNKQKEYNRIYWSFWGDLQYLLLQCVPYDRLTREFQALLAVLERRFNGQTFHYINADGHSGSVHSPVTGKTIGNKQWLQIITNQKLLNRQRPNWKEVEGAFIESSVSTFAGDFESAVKQNPEEMIQMVLEHKDEVASVYIDSMYLGVEFSQYLDQVKPQLLEEMFKVFPCDIENSRASYFCGIIEKTKYDSWSVNVLEKLKEIALHYKGGEIEQKEKNTAELNCEELISRSLNCMRGRALRAIGHLLWDNETLFEYFKEVIDELVKDDNSAVRMACFDALWPIYNINREWAEEKILYVYESDVRMSGFRDSKNMFFRLYPKYRERVLQIVRDCFETDDKRLMQMGGYSVCEFFIRNNEYEDIMSNVVLKEEQAKAILQMAVIYLEYEEFREIGKEIILKYKNSDSDVEFSIGGIFNDERIDLRRDSQFLMEIMKSNVSRRMVFQFVHFLEENACSVRDYATVIVALCENVLSMPQEELSKQWGIDRDISKLIISLYDETTNTGNSEDKMIADRCLELWDVMFERQIGPVRELSRELMER